MKLTKIEKDQIVLKITSTLDTHLRSAFDWIHTDEGQIVVNAIASLSSYVIGDPTGVLMPSIIQSSDLVIRKRFLKRVPDLINRLDKLSFQINEDFVRGETGQNLLRETLKQLIQEENEEKAEILKNFLINSYINTDVNEIRKSTYMKILLSLEPLQLQILRSLWQSDKTAKNIIEKNRGNTGDSTNYSLKHDLPKELGIDELLFERLTVKLESENLISSGERGVNWSSGTYYNTHLQEAIERLGKDTQNVLTEFGKEFVKYIISHAESE